MNERTLSPKTVTLLHPGCAAELLRKLTAAWGELRRAANVQQALDAIQTGADLLLVDDAHWSELQAQLTERLRERLAVIRLTRGKPVPDSSVVACIPEEARSKEALQQIEDALLGMIRVDAVGVGSAEGVEPARLLVVDDSDLLNNITRQILTRAGFDVRCIENPFELTRAFREHKPDLVLIDYNMPAVRGDKVVEVARRGGVSAPMVLYSNAAEATLEEAVRTSGALGYIRKGVPAEMLVGRVRAVLARWRMAQKRIAARAT